MPVNTYRWDTAGAPQLSGTAGALIAVLDYALVTGQGWSKVFSGTNLAVYRAPVGAGNRFYLRVDDTGTTSARVIGYESMTDVNTGVGAFPTAVQFTGGLYVPKSDGPNTNARAWVIVASDRLFHMWLNTSAASQVGDTSAALMWTFGDIKSFRSGDAYGTILIATNSTSGTSNTGSQVASISSPLVGHFMARSYTQLGGSLQVSKFTDMITTTSSIATLPYPNPADNGVYLAPLRIGEFAAYSVMRGSIPGVWAVLHAATNFSGFDVIQGAGPLVGRTFLVVRQYSNAVLAFETSNTWDV